MSNQDARKGQEPKRPNQQGSKDRTPGQAEKGRSEHERNAQKNRDI